MSVQLISTLLLLFGMASVSLAYLIRVFFKGRAQFDRVDKQGGSPLLNKRAMEMGYWFFQGIARLLVLCHITANQITWCSLGLGVLAGISLGFGHFGTGAILAALSVMMDALDGLVARATKSDDGAGAVLDSSIDRYNEFFFIGGLVVYYREIPFLQILTLLALLGSFMVSYSTAKAEAIHVTPPRGSMRRPERALYLILGATLSPITIPWLEQTREFPIAIAHPMVIALALVAVISNFSAVERLVIIARESRQKREKERTTEKERFDEKKNVGVNHKSPATFFH